MSDESEQIPGTWDALEDAAEALNRSGLGYILTVGQSGSRIARTRTNAENVPNLEWLAKRTAENVEAMKEKWE